MGAGHLENLANHVVSDPIVEIPADVAAAIAAATQEVGEAASSAVAEAGKYLDGRALDRARVIFQRGAASVGSAGAVGAVLGSASSKMQQGLGVAQGAIAQVLARFPLGNRANDGTAQGKLVGAAIESFRATDALLDEAVARGVPVAESVRTALLNTFVQLSSQAQDAAQALADSRVADTLKRVVEVAAPAITGKVLGCLRVMQSAAEALGGALEQAGVVSALNTAITTVMGVFR
jgi:hypothetical protein